MRKWLILALLVAACSPSAQAPATSSTATAGTASGAAPTPFVRAGIDVSCHASYQMECGDVGCTAPSGDPSAIAPMAFSFHGASGDGQFCQGETCADARLAALPGQPTGADLMAAVEVHSATGEPTTYPGVISLALDGSAFQYVQPARASTVIWGGACEPTSGE